MPRRKLLGISIIVATCLLLAGPSVDVAARPLATATVPPLGTAGSFAILGGSGLTNTGASTIAGDVGTFPTTTETGFAACPIPANCVTLTGTNHVGDATTQQAKNDLTKAYVNAAGQPCSKDESGVDLGLLTLTPGVYCYTSSAQLTGTLTLNAVGDPNAVWIFQIGSALTTASSSAVSFINAGSGPAGCNVFWQITSSATLGTGTSFVGTIMALTSITVNNSATVLGRALARGAAVTLDTNTITVPACAAATGGGGGGGGGGPGSGVPREAGERGGGGHVRTPSVSGLPNTGGAPIRNEDFPWAPATVVGFSAVVLALWIRAYRRSHLPKP